MNSIIYNILFKSSISLILNGDGAEEGNHDKKMNMAEPHLIPILYSRMYQNLWIYEAGSRVRIHK